MRSDSSSLSCIASAAIVEHKLLVDESGYDNVRPSERARLRGQSHRGSRLQLWQLQRARAAAHSLPCDSRLWLTHLPEAANRLFCHAPFRRPWTRRGTDPRTANR